MRACAAAISHGQRTTQAGKKPADSLSVDPHVWTHNDWLCPQLPPQSYIWSHRLLLTWPPRPAWELLEGLQDLAQWKAPGFLRTSHPFTPKEALALLPPERGSSGCLEGGQGGGLSLFPGKAAASQLCADLAG